MKKLLTAPVLAALAGVLLIIAAGFCVKNRATTPVIIGDRSAPSAAITGFFDALEAHDYDLCAGYVCEYSELGFDDMPEKQSERMIYECLLDSYGCQLLGGIETDTNGVFQRVLITSFDVARLSDDISERFMPAIEHRMNESDDYSAMFSDDGQYSDVLIESALVDVLSELLANPEYYYSTEELRLEVTMDGSEWKLVLSDELVEALTGSIGEED